MKTTKTTIKQNETGQQVPKKARHRARIGALALAMACALSLGFAAEATKAEATPDEIAAANHRLAEEARAVLKKHCATCHGPRGQYAMVMNYVLDRDKLVQRRKVHPGRADRRSKLYERMKRGEMPPDFAPSRPSAEEIATVKRWIDAGAPNWNAPDVAE